MQLKNEPDLFSTNDTVDVDQYFNTSAGVTVAAGSVVSSSTTATSSVTAVESPNNVVPASPTLTFDSEFPTLADDILEQALQSLGEFAKVAENTIRSSVNEHATPTTLDFIQNDDFVDLAWEESFSQLFPTLS